METRSSKDNQQVVTVEVHEEPIEVNLEEQPPQDDTSQPMKKPASKRCKTKTPEAPTSVAIEKPPPARQQTTRQTNKGMDQKLSQVIELLQAQAAQPPRPPPPQAPAALPWETPQQVYAQAVSALQNRLPRARGNMNLTDFLSCQTQRRVREESIDAITFAEFVYAFMGLLAEMCADDDTVNSMVTFLRQVAEDYDNFAWPGILDWALTTIDRVNENAYDWSDSQQISMDRLIISRSVGNAIKTVDITCPEYNHGSCVFKKSHVEGRFKLNHLCQYCFVNGIEHPHSERSCHRKKSQSSSGYKTNNGQSKQENRYRNSRPYDNNHEYRNESKN